MRKLFIISGLIGCAAYLPAPSAAAQAVSPASRPANQPAAPADLPIPLLTLKAVQDVRERNVKWQETADLALGEIKNESLRKQVDQRLELVAQQVSSDLLAKPDAQAIVTIAIYRNPDTKRQALAAVADEGRSDHLSQGFYSRVVSDLPAAPVVQKNQEKLELDELATCYLCFFLDHGNLDAGRIPHPLMKQSVQRAAQTFLARENEGLPQLAGARQAGAPNVAPPAPPQPRSAPVPAYTGSNYAPAAATAYPYSGGLYNGYAYPGYWSPWVAYYPGETAQPVIVQPQGVPQTQPSNPQQTNQNQTSNPTGVVARDPRTGQPLPPESVRDPNAPAPRDPRTGQPAPPPQVTPQQSNPPQNSPAQAAPPPPPSNQGTPQGKAPPSQQSKPAPSAPSQQKSPPPSSGSQSPKASPSGQPAQNAPRQQSPPANNKAQNSPAK